MTVMLSLDFRAFRTEWQFGRTKMTGLLEAKLPIALARGVTY
jgi:hypothetical protein